MTKPLEKKPSQGQKLFKWCEASAMANHIKIKSKPRQTHLLAYHVTHAKRINGREDGDNDDNNDNKRASARQTNKQTNIEDKVKY